MKTCTQCKEHKALSEFYARRGDCKACTLVKMATFRASPEYREMMAATRERRKAYKAKLRREAGAKTIEQRKADAARAQAERDAARQARAALRKHDAHVAGWRKARKGAAWSHRYRNNEEFNAREKVRARLRKMIGDTDLQQHLASEAKAGRWPDKWAALLGYTLEDLVRHLKRTIPKGCTWLDFIDGALHIDHITPRAKFDLSNVDDLRRCWCLSNLRLLTAEENMRKGARMETLL